MRFHFICSFTKTSKLRGFIMKYYSKVLILLTTFYLVGCAGTIKIPKWVGKIPCKKNHVCNVGTADSDRLQMAINEAAQNARIAIGQNLETNLTGLMRQASEEVNDESAINNFQAMAEEILDIQLKDTEIIKQDHQQLRGGKHTVFVLMQFDEGKANERMLLKVEEDKALYDAFRTTQLYDDMKTSVEEFRARNEN